MDRLNAVLFYPGGLLLAGLLPRHGTYRRRMGCDVILGCDAHTPQAVNDPKAEREALALAKEFDLKVLETAVLRSIHK